MNAKRNSKWIATLVILLGILLSACNYSVSKPPQATATLSQTEEPAATEEPVEETPTPGSTVTVVQVSTVPPFVTEEPVEDVTMEVVTYTPVKNAMPLINKGETIGFFWVLNQAGPASVKSPYQSTTLFALGNGTVGDTKVSSDGTEGNVVTLLCNEPQGCDTEVKDYTPGHVGITIILAGKEIPAQTALGAVVNLFNAPNCGGSGCKTNHHYQSGKQETFTTKPSAVKLDVPWESITAQTAIVGEPPANAQVIKIGKKVVGHSYTNSGSFEVSVPEGAGGTILYFPNGGTVNGETVAKGTVWSVNGNLSDGSTPEDLNSTLQVSGTDVQVTMVYLADLKAFVDMAVSSAKAANNFSSQVEGELPAVE